MKDRERRRKDGNEIKVIRGSAGRFTDYTYSLLGLGIATAFATAVGFALVSGIRHLLWLHTMGGEGSSTTTLWLETGTVTIIALVFWYRLISAILRYKYQRRRFMDSMRPYLQAMDETVPPLIRNDAAWYMLEDDQCLAFTWGLFGQRIVLSKGLWQTLDEDARQAVMHHEAAHARMRDPLQQSLLLVLSHAMGPFGLRTLYHRYLVRRELIADQAALTASGGDDVPLLSALVAMTRETEQSLDTRTYAGFASAMQARVQFLETGLMPAWWDGSIRYRLLSSGIAVALTVGEGLLVWCH